VILLQVQMHVDITIHEQKQTGFCHLIDLALAEDAIPQGRPFRMMLTSSLLKTWFPVSAAVSRSVELMVK